MQVQFPSIPLVLKDLTAAFHKFPLSSLSALLFCGLALYQIEIEPFDQHFTLQKLCFTLAVSCPLMLAIHLANNTNIGIALMRYLLLLAGLSILIYLFWQISPDFETVHLQRPVRFFAYFLMAHLAVSVVAVWDRNRQDAFWKFNSNLLIVWFIGSFYALVLFAGLALALVSVDQLFEIHIQGKRYLQLFFIVVSGVHPLYVLANIPEVKSDESVENDQSNILKFLVGYILIPLCILYFIILYAFGLKIVVSWSLPRSWVSSLVLGISGIGVLTYLLNFGLTTMDSARLSRLFKNYFFWLLLPLELLLFAGIFRRLTDYGFTPPRYFVLLAGIWLFGICLYFILAKTKSILWIPFSLMIMLIVGTMSPIDAFKVSSKSQYDLLLSDLGRTSGFENGKLIHTLEELTREEKLNLRDRIRQFDYLGELDKINGLLAFPVVADSLLNAKNGLGLIFKAMGIEEQFDAVNQNEMEYLAGTDQSHYEIAGYRFMVEVDVNRGSKRIGYALPEGPISVLVFTGQIKESLLLEPLMEAIEFRNRQDDHMDGLKEGFILKTTHYNFKVFVKQINYIKKDELYQINYLKALVFAEPIWE